MHVKSIYTWSPIEVTYFNVWFSYQNQHFDSCLSNGRIIILLVICLKKPPLTNLLKRMLVTATLFLFRRAAEY